MALEFQENNTFKSRAIFGEPEKPQMFNFLMKAGIAKNDKSAEYIILGIIGVCVVASIFLFTSLFDKAEQLTPEQINALPPEVKSMLQKK